MMATSFSTWLKKKQLMEAVQQRWFHGTNQQKAKQILSQPNPQLTPGQQTRYKQEMPRQDAVYITSDPEIAKGYALEAGGGVVLELVVDDPTKLLPDEDDVYYALEQGQVAGNRTVAQTVRQFFLQDYNERMTQEFPNHQSYATFEEAWAAFSEVAGQWEEFGSGQLAEEMKDLVDHIVAKNRGLANAIIAAGMKAAYVGAVRVIGVYGGR